VDDWDQASLYMQAMRNLLPDGSVISDEELARFKINTIFTYAAIKKEGNWFITGVQTGQYKSWSQLVSFWKDKVVSIHKVATFDEVFIRETSQNKGVLEGEVLDKDTDYDKPEYNPQA
jgi:hypothetical protein